MWAGEMATHYAKRPFALIASKHIDISIFEITSQPL